MIQNLEATLQVIWACTIKDIKSALTERTTLVQTITLPVNYLIMLSLFVLSGSNAPTAVVMLDQGPSAQAFYQAMSQAHTFHLIPLTAAQAHDQLLAGKLVAVVTIPANFDEAIALRQPIQVPVDINNLDEDLTDDVHRGVRLSLTTFYAQSFPKLVSIVTQEQDAYRHDTDYIPFLAMSIMVISLMVTGLLQAGMSSAREWEKGTIKELLLAPAQVWMMLAGKMLSVFVIGLPSVIVVLAILVFIVGDWPANFPLVIGVSLLTLFVFVAAGVALGMALKERMTLTIITRSLAVPLFFLSGVFGPVSFSTPAVQTLARLFPVHYAIVLEQYAFKNFVTNTMGLVPNTLILAGYVFVFAILATIAMRCGKVTH
jgi:ABC-2 type transport system permease protein